MKLSEIKIKNAKPKAKDYLLSDGYNLYLLIKPNASKLWKFIYQSPETGKQLKLSLGKYPFKTLTEAREEARNYYKLLSDGICPKTHLEQQAQKAEEENEELRSFAYKWIEWKKQRAETKKPLNPKTIKKTMQRLENHLFPRFEGVRLADITLRNVVQALDEPYKKTPDTIYRIARNLVEIMDYAAILERVPLNPLHSLKKVFNPPKAVNQPAITPAELAEFLDDLQRSSRSPVTKLLVEWQLVTMLRPFEAVAVKWSDIDFQNKLLTIPAERMKGGERAHTIPLSTQALAIIEELKGYSGHYEYLFAGRNDRKKPVNSQTVNNAIKRIKNGKYKGLLVAHGLRSIASTYLNDKFTGEPFVIEACLSHVGNDKVRNAYFRGSYLERRAEIMQAWGDFIERSKYPSKKNDRP